jgi:hypothetical protein
VHGQVYAVKFGDAFIKHLKLHILCKIKTLGPNDGTTVEKPIAYTIM